MHEGWEKIGERAMLYCATACMAHVVCIGNSIFFSYELGR